MSYRQSVYVSLKTAEPRVTAEVRVFFPPTLEGLAVAKAFFVEAARQAAEKLEQVSSRVPHHEARKGDVAEHKSNQLDPRLVAEIDIETNSVWLVLGEEKIGPFPADNYRYFRHTKEQEAQ